MKRILIPLLIAALLCFGIAAAAEGSSFSFDPGTIQVSEGETCQTVLIREGEAASGEVTYKSSDARIATVDEAGLVTAVKKGKVTISASVKAGNKTLKASLRLTVVRPVVSVSVKTDKLRVFAATDESVSPFLKVRDNAEENKLPVLVIPVKKKLQLTASVEPKDATDRKVVLSGSDPGVFSVAGSSVTGVAPGEGILTVASESNPEISTRFRVLVVQPVKKLLVEASAPFVVVGGQVSLTSSTVPDDATVKNVEWSSGDERILKVDGTGTAFGVKRGTGRVIAASTDGSNVRANFSLKVVQNPESITLKETEKTIDVGRSSPMKATVLPKDADNKKLIWTSSDESIATVDQHGRIKAVSVGTCTVTCTSEALDTVSASVTVHVQQPVKKVRFNDKTALVFVGETTQLAWTIEPADATNPALDFSSSKDAIITVDQGGLVTGVSSGKAYVNAVTTDGSRRKARILVHAGKHVSGVHMVRRHAYIDPGEAAGAGAVIEPKDALVKDMTWESSDESIVTVSSKKGSRVTLHGQGYGNAVVTGRTVDGGFETSIPVTVGDFDHGIKLIDYGYDSGGDFWFVVRNDLDMTVTEITATVEVYDGDNNPVAVNKKDGSNKVEVIWSGSLNPGEKTGKRHWKMKDYSAPDGGIGSTHGTVTLCSYQIENDWVKTIRKGHRPHKNY